MEDLEVIHMIVGINLREIEKGEKRQDPKLGEDGNKIER
jgi:hypothetical protein